jgi:hypothetical protein
MNSKYDAILVCNVDDIISSINEDYGDPRSFTGAGYGKNVGKVPYLWYDDPRLYASNAFGQMMLNDLNAWKKGYSAKVTDFGKWVVVEVTHHNHVTGRSASKTFLVVFDGGPKGTDKGGGMVLTTANKWRTISGYSQASSYIKAASAALESATSAKI